jgi:hypothetical protein
VTAALILAACAGSARAERAVGIGTITGRDFAGIDLPAQVQDRTITMASDRSWAWAEGATSRVALEGDVRVSIGNQTFRAASAVVWLEPIAAMTPEGVELAADQVAIVFEGVTSAGAAPGDAETHRAERLLVTGIVRGPSPELKTDLLVRERPRDGDEAFVARAEDRLARYLTELVGGEGARDSAAVLAQQASRAGDDRGTIAPAVRTPAVPPEGGTISYSAGRVEMSAHETGERVIELSEGLSVQFVPPDRGRTVMLQAERGVVFLTEAAAGASAGVMRSAEVSGLYIEGDASITDGQYTLRGSRMYYDPQAERAVVLDAVFLTWDQQRGMPLYLRADTIRQTARGEWKAERATLANASLAEPHFSIGAEQLTIRQQPGAINADGSSGAAGVPVVEAEGVGFRAGSLPLLGLPRFEGEVRPSPLRDVRYSSRGGDHLVSTRWDLFTLLQRESSPGSRLDLLADAYFTRGPAVGLDAAWERGQMTGESLSYAIYDNGRDRLSSGARIDRDDEFRGMFTVGNIWRVSELWTLTLEGSYISDEAFVDAFFDELGESRREFTNSAMAKRQTDQDLFSIEVRGTFNDFIANEYLLQSQGYVVQNLPEARYVRFSDQVFDIISYSTENSVGYYNAQFSEPEVRDYGFNNRRRAEAAFGLSPTDSLADALDARNFPENGVGRFDTRHEIEVPLSWGPMQIVPFGVGRGTWWSRDFDGYDGTDGVEDDGRVWGAAGVRSSTSLVHVNDTIDSRLFDLHRTRHIIEPYATAWVAGTNVDPDRLPVFDEGVESLADGTMINTGVRQTWQTERGPARARRSVDWLVIDLSHTWSSDDAPRKSPFGRFLSYRPELSNPGEFVRGSGSLLLTEAVTLVAEGVYDLDGDSGDEFGTDEGFSRGSVGIELDHGDAFTTYTEYRYLRDFDDTVLAMGTRYELTTKYAIALEGTWNLDENRFQNSGAVITRRFAQWTVDVAIGFDETSDIFEAGISVRPVGFSGDTRRRPFTYDEDFDVIAAPVTPDTGRVESGPFGIGR